MNNLRLAFTEVNIISSMPSVGLAIRHYREKNRLSNKELAKASRISESYLSMLEKGERGERISYRVLANIADALGVTIDDLESWKPPKLGWLNENYDILTGDQQKKIDDVVLALKKEMGLDSDTEAATKRKSKRP